MINLKCCIMDEHSQAGRPFWSWFKLHHEEFRRPAQLTDDAMNTIFDESINFNLPIQTYNCPWGGIPFIYFFGDCSQLPPVMMKVYLMNHLEVLVQLICMLELSKLNFSIFLIIQLQNPLQF